MYVRKPKVCAWIAFGYYGLYLPGLCLIAVLMQRSRVWYYLIYLAFFAIPAISVPLKEKNFSSLGFTGQKLKANLLISGAFVAVTVLISVAVSELPVIELVKKTLYYLFFIALVEEMLFRGFIQSYLCGLFEYGMREGSIFAIGALMFALMHIPFQFMVSNMGFLSFFAERFGQLTFSVLFHLTMCFITDKRGDILIPTAIHFAINYLQSV